MGLAQFVSVFTGDHITEHSTPVVTSQVTVWGNNNFSQCLGNVLASTIQHRLSTFAEMALCWSTFNFLLLGTPGPSPWNCFLHRQCLASTAACELLAQRQDLASAFAELLEVSVSSFLQHYSEWPPCMLTIPHQCGILHKFTECLMSHWLDC